MTETSQNQSSERQDIKQFIVSFWHETVDMSARHPPLGDTIDADIVIIGGGYCGLSTAFYLKRAQPGLRVVILEGSVCGYGASGRNAGFAMTLFGLTMSLLKLRFGKQAVREAQNFMEAAVDHVGELVNQHGIQCDYQRGGLLTVAISPSGIKRLQRETRLANSLGLDGIHYISAEETRQRVNSATYLGARFEENSALVNPAKFLRGLMQLAETEGVEIYEESPVIAVNPGAAGGPIIVETARGQVRARKLLFATNAYANAFPQLARKQMPIGTYVILTEPLTREQLAPIGWTNREGIEDSQEMINYYRLTADNRLLMGGGDIRIKYGSGLPDDYEPAIFRGLETHLAQTFPSLRNVAITHRWGGPISATLDLTPAFGWIGNDRRMAYSFGCLGHGLALMTYSGQLLRDLLLENKSALTDLFFVNRTIIPWPPEPLRFAAAQVIRSYMRLADSLHRRRVAQPTESGDQLSEAKTSV